MKNYKRDCNVDIVGVCCVYVWYHYHYDNQVGADRGFSVVSTGRFPLSLDATRTTRKRDSASGLGEGWEKAIYFQKPIRPPPVFFASITGGQVELSITLPQFHSAATAVVHPIRWHCRIGNASWHGQWASPVGVAGWRCRMARPVGKAGDHCPCS